MRKILISVFLLAAAFSLKSATPTPTNSPTPTASPTPAVLAPENLSLGILQPGNSVPLDWDDDAKISQWNVYFGGVQKITAPRSQVTYPSSGRVRYFVAGLPLGATTVLTLRAVSGRGTSAESSAVTITAAAAPFSYVASDFTALATDTYTTTGSGVVKAFAFPLKSYSIEVCSTGAPATAWNVTLEGSLDGVNYTTILTHTDGDGDCSTVFTTTSFFPAFYFKSVCNSLTLSPATNIVVTILGTP
jgi:hypothetical protein